MNTVRKATLHFILFLVVLLPAVASAGEENPAPAYTLPECIDIALMRSPDVLTAAQEVKRANGVVWETWSNIVSVSVSSKYTLTEPGINTLASPSQKDFTLYLEGSIPVFSGGRVLNGVPAAYLNRDIAREGYRKAVNETVYNVRNAFWRLLLDRESVRVQKENVDFLEKTHETIQHKYDVGLASWFELLRSRVELANAQPSLMEAEDTLEADMDDLKRLMGTNVDDTIEIAGDLAFSDTTAVLEDSLSRALLQNPDILIAALTEDVARKQVRSAIGEYFPTISVFGEYAYSSDTVEVTFDDDRWESIGGVMVTMPITDLIGTSARLKQARAQLNEAGIARRDTENGIKLKIKTAFRDLVRSKKVVESQKENVRLASEGLDIAQIQYDNGINTYLELMDTRLALTQANLNYINAVYTNLEAAARLEYLSGTDPAITKPPAETGGGPDGTDQQPPVTGTTTSDKEKK
jgi:outer membrane protein